MAEESSGSKEESKASVELVMDPGPDTPAIEAARRAALAKAEAARKAERWAAGAANALTSIFVALEMSAESVARVVVARERDQELVRSMVLGAGWPKPFESRIQISSAVDVPLIIASSRPMLLICLSASPGE